MKKNCSKKIRIIAMMIALAVIVQVYAPALTAKAADKPYVYDMTGVYEPQSKQQIDWLFIENFPENAKVKNLKSSNNKVLKVSWKKNNPDCIQLNFKKTGKATVSFDLVYDGVTKSLKSKVTVIKYQRPCSSCKIGKKNYASKLKNTSVYTTTYKGTHKYKVSIKAAKGWKLDGIYYWNNKMKTDKKIKNNTTIKLTGKKGDYTALYVNFQNKKTKKWQGINVFLECR